jgi:hypothetical protein
MPSTAAWHEMGCGADELDHLPTGVALAKDFEMVQL